MKHSGHAVVKRLAGLLGHGRASPVAGMAMTTAPMSDEVLTQHEVDRKGLFIVGAARSGTTVLQNALNDSPDIFLFGEPAFHDDPGTPNFAERYNAMHRAWGNQETKSSLCPPLFAGDEAWHAYLARLAQMHKFVGSKIVINPEHALTTCAKLFDFHCRSFFRSHYIFSFRNPIDVLMSTRGLAELNGDPAASHESVLRSYVGVIGLFIRSLRNLPHVTAVFHEDMGPATFARIGSWLDVDLDGASDYYDATRVRHYTMDAIPERARPYAAAVAELYEDFRAQAQAGFSLVQLEQNAGNFSPGHATPLGALHGRVSQLLASA